MPEHVTTARSRSTSFLHTAKKEAPPFFPPVTVQPKLTVSAADDPYEREADATADKVMRMTNHEAVHAAPAPLVIQKKCAACEAEEKLHRKENDEDRAIQLKPIAPIQRKCAACEAEEHVHRHAAGTGVPAVTPAVQQTLQSAGQPMDNGTRSFMEQRFGYDFGQVQIHNDSLAHQSSADISAHAFTHGSHIVFGAGQYQPHTSSGRQLLAHELTHVVQQNHSSIKRKQGLVQRAPKDIPMTRDAEIRQSMTSPGQFDFTPSTMTVSIYNFGINKHDLKKEHKKILDEIALLVKIMPPDKWDILITGEADSTGEPELNNPLSENRANEVKKYIKKASGVSLRSLGEGEDNPIASNENVSGRTRNRRVDIRFIPKFKIIPPPPPPPCEKEPCEDKKKSLCERHPDIPLLCRGFDCTGSIFEALACMLITCLLEPFAAICKCLETPALCFCIKFPSLCTPKTKKKPKACPTKVDLPHGRQAVGESWPFMMLRNSDFTMRLTFDDDPQKGCACRCGEYKQNVRGFFETAYADGTVKRGKKPLTPGIFLEEKTFHEDGNGKVNSEYGHRSHLPRFNSAFSPDDRFEPNQAAGCQYIGNDAPGMGPAKEWEHEVRLTMFLEFEGGPVDTCTIPGVRTEMRKYWHRWEVSGEIRKPPPPKGPGGGPGPGGGTGPRKRVRVTGRKTTAPSVTPYGAYYGGGISPTAKKGDVYTLSLDFNVAGRDEVFTYDVTVTVIDADADSITIRTHNAYDQNIAPPGAPDIILKAHKTATIKREMLK